MARAQLDNRAGSWFAQIFGESFFLQPLLAENSNFRLALSGAVTDAEDIADVATAALMDDRQIGQPIRSLPGC